MDHIISPEGMGKNDYIKTSRNLIVVTAPGPGSGKLATCMSNMYLTNLMASSLVMLSLKPSPYGTFLSIIQLTWLMRLLLQTLTMSI